MPDAPTPESYEEFCHNLSLRNQMYYFLCMCSPSHKTLHSNPNDVTLGGVSNSPQTEHTNDRNSAIQAPKETSP